MTDIIVTSENDPVLTRDCIVANENNALQGSRSLPDTNELLSSSSADHGEASKPPTLSPLNSANGASSSSSSPDSQLANSIDTVNNASSSLAAPSNGETATASVEAGLPSRISVSMDSCIPIPDPHVPLDPESRALLEAFAGPDTFCGGCMPSIVTLEAQASQVLDRRGSGS